MRWCSCCWRLPSRLFVMWMLVRLLLVLLAVLSLVSAVLVVWVLRVADVLLVAFVFVVCVGRCHIQRERRLRALLLGL